VVDLRLVFCMERAENTDQTVIIVVQWNVGNTSTTMGILVDEVLEVMNIEEYVVGKALDGLFYMVAQEEKQIRKNPAARVTSVLKDIFGRR
jgi:hypothetical protein